MTCKINWRGKGGVWPTFLDWCAWMDMPITNALRYQMDRIERLVNAELRGAKRKGVRGK